MWPFRTKKNKNSKMLSNDELLLRSIQEKLQDYARQACQGKQRMPASFSGPPCFSEHACGYYTFEVVDYEYKATDTQEAPLEIEPPLLTRRPS